MASNCNSGRGLFNHVVGTQFNTIYMATDALRAGAESRPPTTPRPNPKSKRRRNIIPADIVIAVMGPTGVGKSTFINAAAGPGYQVKVGSQLTSCTSEVEAVAITHEGHKVVLVDTPGFDDTYCSDTVVLGKIAEWLQKTYQNHVKLAGIIYMHRITDNRMSGAPIKNLKMFSKLCGTRAADKVVLTSTMWDLVNEDVGERRENELTATFWKGMIDHKAAVARFEYTHESAWNILRPLCFNPQREALLLQEEMVDLGRQLSETHAGRAMYDELRRGLEEGLRVIDELSVVAKTGGDVDLAADLREQLERQQEVIEHVAAQINSLKIPLGTRICRAFGLMKKTHADPIHLPPGLND